MKYRRLIKEELEPLAEDFAIFLATNSIDKKEWNAMKIDSPEKASEMLDIFSDMVFEKALASARYLARIAEAEMQCYLFQEKQAHMISVSCLNSGEKNFANTNLADFSPDEIEITQGVKQFKKSREEEMFAILQTGAELSDGKVYQQLLKLI
jgi:hypothetical protein